MTMALRIEQLEKGNKVTLALCEGWMEVVDVYIRDGLILAIDKRFMVYFSIQIDDIWVEETCHTTLESADLCCAEMLLNKVAGYRECICTHPTMTLRQDVLCE
jgi:hypothetical protein